MPLPGKQWMCCGKKVLEAPGCVYGSHEEKLDAATVTAATKPPQPSIKRIYDL